MSTPSSLQEVQSKTFLQRNKGLLLITLAQCFFSAMSAAVKVMNSLDPPISTMELIAVRMTLTGLFSLSYMIIAGVKDPILGPKGIRHLLVFRGLAGFVTLSGFYTSLKYLSLSDATVLIFLSPTLILFTGAAFLGEPFSHKQLLAGLVSFGGVILIARPTFLFDSDYTGPVQINPSDRLFSVGGGLVSVLGACSAYTVLRSIGKRAHAMNVMMYFSTFCVLGSAFSMLVTRTPVVVPTRLDWLLLLIFIGVFGFLSQLLLTIGLRFETVSRGSMAIYTQIVFATVFERIIFHTYPTVYSALGIILICGSALFIAISKASSENELMTGPIRLPNDDVEEPHIESRISD